MSKKNKFYWIEGVTAREITSSLNDPRWSPLRTRPVRRALVVSYSVLLVAVGILSVVSDDANPWLDIAVLLGILLMLVGYLVIRGSVRNLADAPDELLDERQIAVRNEVYLHAYRLTVLPVLLALVLYAIGAQSPEFLWMSMAMTFAALPSLVLAWNLPGETRDAGQD